MWVFDNEPMDPANRARAAALPLSEAAVMVLSSAALWALLYALTNALLKTWVGFCLGENAAMLFITVLDWKFLFLGAALLSWPWLWRPDAWARLLPAGDRRLRLSWAVVAAAFTLRVALIALAPGKFGAPAPVRNALGFFAMTPGQDAVERRERNPSVPPMHVRTNSYGYRDDEWDLRAPLKRAVLVGNSFVWGVGIREKAGMLDACLERELNSGARGARWDVLNVGLRPSSIGYYIAVLEAAGEKLRPDVLIMSFVSPKDVCLVDEQLALSSQPLGLALLLLSFGVIQDIMWHNAVGMTGELDPRAWEQRLLRPWRRERVRARFQGLLALLEERRLPLIIWEHREHDPFFDPFRRHALLTFVDWLGTGRPAIEPGFQGPGVGWVSSLDGWLLEKGFAVPNDGHPTELANQEFAKVLARAIPTALARARPGRPSMDK